MAPNANVLNLLNRGLLIALILSLVLNCVNQVSAQKFGISDLPTCAQPCVTLATNTVGCQTTNTACLCSNFGVFSNFVEQCANDSCGIEDISSVGGILDQLCTNQSSSSSPSSSSPSTSTSSSASTTSKASVTTPTTSTTQATTTSSSASFSIQTTTSSATSSPPSVATSITPAHSLTTSSSSTLVVVQTVVLPQSSSSSLPNAARTTAVVAMNDMLALLATGWVLGAALL